MKVNLTVDLSPAEVRALAWQYGAGPRVHAGAKYALGQIVKRGVEQTLTGYFSAADAAKEPGR